MASPELCPYTLLLDNCECALTAHSFGFTDTHVAGSDFIPAIKCRDSIIRQKKMKTSIEAIVISATPVLQFLYKAIEQC